MKTPCSPRIWEKLNLFQREMWLDFYHVFSEEYNFHPKHQPNKEQLDVAAHNMACNAIWVMNENFKQLFAENMPKKKKAKMPMEGKKHEKMEKKGKKC